MQAYHGQSTALSLILIRNGAPWPGRTVSVRVVSAAGLELLASTPAPETSEPGLYSVPWMAPSAIGQAVALWTSGLRTWSEQIEVVASPPAASQAIVGIVEGDEVDPLVGVMGREEQIEGVIGRSESTVAVVNPGDSSSGVVGAILSDDGKTVTAILQEK